jgi:putative exporter of polyketide antibiotics
MTIIEKFGDKFDPSLLNGIPPDFSGIKWGKSFGALKAGCLLLGLGLGLLVGMFISTSLIANGYDIDNWQNREMLFSVAYSSSLLLFGGAGLIAAFVIENKMRSREKQG